MTIPSYVRRLDRMPRSRRRIREPVVLPFICLRVYRSYTRSDGKLGHEIPWQNLRWDRDGVPQLGDIVDNIVGHERRTVTVIERRWVKERHWRGRLHITCASLPIDGLCELPDSLAQHLEDDETA